MNTELCPGDLVTGRQGLDTKIIASLAGDPDGWDLWILRSSIMTVVKAPSELGGWSTGGLGTATVLHDNKLIEVFLHDIKRWGCRTDE